MKRYLPFGGWFSRKRACTNEPDILRGALEIPTVYEVVRKYLDPREGIVLTGISPAVFKWECIFRQNHPILYKQDLFYDAVVTGSAYACRATKNRMETFMDTTTVPKLFVECCAEGSFDSVRYLLGLNDLDSHVYENMIFSIMSMSYKLMLNIFRDSLLHIEPFGQIIQEIDNSKHRCSEADPTPVLYMIMSELIWFKGNQPKNLLDCPTIVMMQSHNKLVSELEKLSVLWPQVEDNASELLIKETEKRCPSILRGVKTRRQRTGTEISLYAIVEGIGAACCMGHQNISKWLLKKFHRSSVCGPSIDRKLTYSYTSCIKVFNTDSDYKFTHIPALIRGDHLYRYPWCIACARGDIEAIKTITQFEFEHCELVGLRLMIRHGHIDALTEFCKMWKFKVSDDELSVLVRYHSFFFFFLKKNTVKQC